MAEQLGFILAAAPHSNTAPAVVSVDYTQMRIGTVVGSGRAPRDIYETAKPALRVEECGNCSKPGITKHNDNNLVWVHSEEISTTPNGRSKRRLISVCRMKRK